jgi:hypothetical protein
VVQEDYAQETVNVLEDLLLLHKMLPQIKLKTPPPIKLNLLNKWILQDVFANLDSLDYFANTKIPILRNTKVLLVRWFLPSEKFSLNQQLATLILKLTNYLNPFWPLLLPQIPLLLT